MALLTRDVEQLREPAHRQVAVMLEDPQNVEVRHADPGFDHPAGAGAAKAADHRVELVDDAVDELTAVVDSTGASPGHWAGSRVGIVRIE